MPSRYKPPSTSNIRRIDSHKSHGYQVHVERDGKVITKHFSDSQYPSPAQARRAAMAYRDKVLAEVPPPANRQGYRTKAKSNTGEVGISYTYMTRRTGDRKPYITVSVSPEPGRMLGRKFSVERLGYEGAIAEAKAWRAEILQQRTQRQEAERRKELARLAKRSAVQQPQAGPEPEPVAAAPAADGTLEAPRTPRVSIGGRRRRRAILRSSTKKQQA